MSKIRLFLLNIIYPKWLFHYIVCSKAKSHGKVLIRRYSTVNKGTIIGDQVAIGGIHIVGKGNCHIGNYVHTGTDCQILTDYHNYDGGELIPYDHSWVVEDVSIGDFVWLGNNVIILAGVTIGEGAIIQAGSVVVNDIPPMAIAGGHPAKVFKYRDVEHFQKLKSEGKFLMLD
ncbi:MAG: acyltransferase [Bacteroidales bacterium]|nr:acyltransferase [Bacteroidales bacterium]